MIFEYVCNMLIRPEKDTRQHCLNLLYWKMAITLEPHNRNYPVPLIKARSGLRKVFHSDSLHIITMAVALCFIAGNLSYAQNFVFKNATYGYLYNNNGSLAASSSFSPASVWVSSSDDPTTANQSIRSYSQNTRYLRGAQNGNATLGASQNGWQQRSGGMAYRYNNTTYYLKYNNNGTITTSSGNNGARFTVYGVAVKDFNAVDNTTAPTISVSGTNGNGLQFTHTDVTGTVRPAYTVFTIDDGTTHYWCNDEDLQAAPGTVNVSAMNPTYAWSIQSGNNASINNNGVLTFSAEPTGNIVVLLTTTIPAVATKTTTYTLNVGQRVASSSEEVEDPMSVTPSSVNLDMGESVVVTGPSSYVVRTMTRPQYRPITAGGVTYYYYSGTVSGSMPVPVETGVTTTALNHYEWSASGNDAGLISQSVYWSSNSSSNTISRTTNVNPSTEPVVITMNVTAAFGNWGNEMIERYFTVTITVPGARAELTSITASNLSLNLGESAAIQYSYEPSAAQDPYVEIVFTSSDNQVATVNSAGVVQAVGVGTAAITLQSITSSGWNGVNTFITVTVTSRASAPTFTKDGTTITLSTVTPNARIYYTLDGSDPTLDSPYVASGGNVTVQYGQTIRAAAANIDGGYALSVISEYTNINGNIPVQTYPITSQADLEYMAQHPSYNYEVQNSFTVSSSFTATTNFSGTFDGGYYVISGLTQPLFNTVNNGTVKNVILDDVTINGGAYVGAIANRALNDSRIYNCGVLSTNGSSVRGSGSVGGLVGEVSDNAKVINCYNYATVTGGTYAGGIVGNVVDPNAAGGYYGMQDDCSQIANWSRTGNNLGGNFQVTTNRPEDYSGVLNDRSMEVWRAADAGLQNQQIRHSNITGLSAGTYNVSVTAVMINQQNNSNTPSGLRFYLNGSTYEVAGAVQGQNGARYVEVEVSVNVTVGQNGTITLGFNIENARYFNWFIWDNLTVTKTASVHVTNCMMYGDITAGTNRSPVYCGNHRSNVRDYTEYNFYRSKANLTYTAYNDQLAIDKDEYLTRFPFYRHIQNTHRELTSFFLFNDRTTAHVSEIGHWVLKPDVAPYPIIEEWRTDTRRTTVDIAANLPNTTDDYAGRLLTDADMGTSGYLTVNVRINGSTFTSNLPITDMDTLNYDFTWGKVVLPFANEYSGWTRDYSKICTGWKIISVTGGTPGTLTNYNFADRYSTVKDIYNATTNPYIFAQGGNYIVPYGVTAITIEANMANAFYLSDATYEVAYSNTYGNATGLGGAVSGTYHGRQVYTSITTLVNALATTTNPHEQAIVLVGNYHYNQSATGVGFNTGKALSVMSVDEDNNQEPDYGWYVYQTENRTKLPPIRFDFVPQIGIGMAARVTGSTPYPQVGILHPAGWFEYTETSLVFMNECETNTGISTSNDNGYGNNRWIVNSGYFMQIIRGFSGGNDTKLSYMQIGGSAYVEQLYPGSHVAQNGTTTIRPIIVTGGEIERCYMTGNKNNAIGPDIFFWCAGGRIHKWLAAFTSNPSTNGVNVTAKVDHAIIRRFFGGGTSAAARITGNIDVTMDHSLVDFYCGGPEFGDMNSGKTVTTHAKGTTFGEYYGAGFGGTSLSTVYITETSGVSFANDSQYPLSFSTNYKRLQTSGSYGLGVGYEFDYILYSGGVGTGVARFYTKYARFSLATTGNVTNVLEGCTVKGNFYGAGCQGRVNGTVTSTLTDCTFEGNVFGGGYKASANTLDVYPTTQPTYSRYTKETGLFSGFGNVQPETWSWRQGTVDTYDAGSKVIYTNVDMSTLGNVTGAISLTISGGSVARNVFGGGNESPSRNNTSVIVTDNTVVSGNVFGGGNVATVDGSTSVAINEAVLDNMVYGGGNEAGVVGNANVHLAGGTVSGGIYGGCNTSGTVAGNVEVLLSSGIIGTSEQLGYVHGGGYGNVTSVTGNVLLSIGDEPTGNDKSANRNNVNNLVIYADVYGGSALGSTCTAAGKNSAVKMYSGTVNGDIYGGALGSPSVAASMGAVNQTVDIYGGRVTGSVYGGSNINASLLRSSQSGVTVHNTATPQPGEYGLGYVFGGGNGSIAADNGQPGAHCGDTFVTLLGGSVGNAFGGGNASTSQSTLMSVNGGSHGNIFGGGNLGDVTGTVTVNVTSGQVTGDIYGGGALANTNTSSALTLTRLNLTGGNVNNVYGGGLGDASHPATVGTVILELNRDVSASDRGCAVSGNIFGCNNVNGAPYGDVTVHVYATQNVNQSNMIGKTLDVYDIEAIYGGGNMAAYKPLDPTSSKTHVIIEGCTLSSVRYVYGGGNAAPVPATDVLIMGNYQIGDVFGGGNGKDSIIVLGVLTPNPGADVGIYKVDVTDDVWESMDDRLKYDDKGDLKDGDHYVMYGDTAGTGIGTTHVTILGGTIKQVFGGSNTKGDIIKEAVVELGDEDLKTCDFDVDYVYGGSNEAYMSGSAEIDINCIEGISELYGGSKMADVNGDIVLTISGGSYDRVFGGNNISGRIYGSITVNVEQTGCLPIVIGELYGGGNMAPYSIFGYLNTTHTHEIDGKSYVHYDLRTYGDTQYDDPVINIVSCESIGTVYGGGFKAEVVGSPTVNVNMIKGWTNGGYTGQKPGNPESYPELVNTKYSFDHIGTIGQVFGGGNQAVVNGNTTVNIGSSETVTVHNVTKAVYNAIRSNHQFVGASPFSDGDPDDATADLKVQTEGAIVTGNVYGGGNQAAVNGKSHIQIGFDE